MTERTKFYLSKYAATAPTALNFMRLIAPTTGALALSPIVPWNTLGAVRDSINGNSSKDEYPQSIATDIGRGAGTALGIGAATGIATHFHMPRSNGLLNAAVLLGGAGAGALLGHLRGKAVGQQLFPGSLSDRVHRLIQNF